MISFRFLGAGIPRIINEVGNKHRQQQEPSLYSSAAPKGARKPHCSHIGSYMLHLTHSEVLYCCWSLKCETVRC